MSPSTPQLIEWHVRFNTGHAQIDAQHRELVDLLNHFAADVTAEGTEHTRLFAVFREALRKHFLYEEAALRRMGVTDELLEEHNSHHVESMKLLDGLGQQLISDPREHSSSVLAEIAHCLLLDLVDEDRYYFLAASSREKPTNTTPPIAPVLHAYGRLVDMLNEHQEEIAHARDYYLTLLADFPTPIFRSDPSGRFDWFNQTWLAFTGKTHQEAVAYGWMNAIHGDDREHFLQHWQTCFEKRTLFTLDARLQNANGQWRWMHYVGHPFYDDAQGFLGYICTLLDINERKQAEADLRISAQVFEHAAEAIMITDAHGHIEAVNPAFTRITGYSADEAKGASANLLRSEVHSDEFYQTLWQTSMDEGYWEGEIINRRKSGEIFPAWLSISVIRDAEGQLLRMVGVLSELAAAGPHPKKLLQLAHQDALTGLPNRLLFGARAQHSIERCSREGSRLAILFIDLDKFKPVNDTLGHRAGDQALKEIAALLRGALRAEDTVARLGGDEFVVLVERANNANDASRVVAKLKERFPYLISAGQGKTLAIHASIGVSLYPDDGETVDDLIEAADRDMYRAKEAARR